MKKLNIILILSIATIICSSLQAQTAFISNDGQNNRVKNQGTMVQSNGPKQKKLFLYPNPAIDQVNITSDVKGFNLTLRTLKLYNNLSQEVMGLQFQPSAEMKMNVEGLSPGVYSVRITSGNQTYTQKLIVQTK
jgi:hypothetical protein